GAACVVADVATKIKPATAIANVVRSMCLSLLGASSFSTQLFASLKKRSSWTEVQFGTPPLFALGHKRTYRGAVVMSVAIRSHRRRVAGVATTPGHPAPSPS